MSPYSYSPLTHSRDFRLLKIHDVESSRRSNGLRGRELELVHARIDGAPAYETISYVWGGSDKSHVVQLAHDRTLRITETLHRLLPYVIRASKTGYLWLDQLCINQDDMTERSHQVALMADIYIIAQRTIVWLCEADNWSQIIADISRDLDSTDYHFAARSWDASESEKRRDKIIAYLKSRCSQGCPLHGSSENSKPRSNKGTSSSSSTDCGLFQGLEANFRVFRLPWFSRCWVVQEALLSREAHMMIGNTLFAPCDLYSTALNIQSIRVPNTTRKTIPSIWQEGCGWHPFNWMMHYWGKVHHGQWGMFAMLLSTLRSVSVGGLTKLSDKKGILSSLAVREHLGVSDKRDIIYSHLGLHSHSRDLIKPDYSLNVQQVFIDATRAFIEETQDLMVLGLCDKTYGENGVQGLPSWVPDWSTRVRMMPLIDLKTKYNGLGFDWSFTASGGYEHRVQPRGLSPRLLVRGIRMDVVSAIHPCRFEDFDTAVSGKDQDPFELEQMVQDMSNGSSFPLTSPWDLEEVSVGRILQVMALARHGGPVRMLSSYRGGAEEDLEMILRHSRGRRICRGLYDNRSLGMVPAPAKTGDEVWVLHGCPTPVVLREKTRVEFELVGACYFEGLMYCDTAAWAEEEAESVYLV